MSDDKSYITQCTREIEKVLGWGSSKHWTSSDFRKLSEHIWEKTNVNLSVTTLKRIWGKVKYTSEPTINTLNTLAQFLGHDNWRAYRNRLENAPTEEKVAQASGILKSRARYMWNGKSSKSRLIVASSVMAVAVLVLLVLSSSPKINPEDYQFSSNTIAAGGVPNSVVFEYDASKAPTEKVYIQQNWDPSRRTLVSKNNHHHTSIYYYPGYFSAKLVIGDQVVREHDLFIVSDGWVAAIHNQPVPLYLDRKDYMQGDVLEINTKMINAAGISMQPEIPELRVVNVRQMDDLKTDNFTFNTTVRNDFKRGSAACQKVVVFILCKNDVIIVPLLSKRCVGDIGIFAAGAQVTSQEADLSGFGAEMSEWTHLNIECKEGHMRFMVNGNEAYDLVLKNPPSEIIGVQYRFEGVGAIKDTRFSHAETIFEF
ncbi:hypothetical protein [Negadavirga shengliensis]|uniref:Uncharacterized protein n=1 Tax=Negadavirga shengliensis TaxID=1389218 RepID=A0ABV9T7Q7_9BACT